LCYYFGMYYPYRIILVLLAAALILNGCILERIFRVKNQLCNFEKNFQIDTSKGFRVVLRDPVLLDEDITWLAGAQPSEQKFAGDELVMTYIAERKGIQSHGQYDLPIELRFVRRDGKYRLKEGYLSKNLADMLTDALLTQIMQSVCQSERSLVKQQITIDIRTLDRTLLPAGSEITAILGPPNPKSGIEHRQIYDYQLRNHDAVDKEPTIEIVFDDTDDKILSIKVKYLRYNLEADFEKGEAVLKVDIFLEEET
jgi:hypothetical protein